MKLLIFRTILIYLCVLFAMRLMGKRQLGELQPEELVSTILISNLASISIESEEVPVTASLIPLFLIAALELLGSILSFRSQRFFNLMSGRPKTVILNGEIDQNALRTLRLTAADLMEALRGKDIFDPRKVSYAVIETNGTLSAALRPEQEAATLSDLQLKVQQTQATIPFVLDGQVLEEDFRVPVKWVEGRSLDTRQNADFSAQLLLPQGVKRVVLVTHAAHMHRSVEAFEHTGLAVVPAPTAFFGGPGKDDNLLPKLPGINTAYAGGYAAHEWVGILAYRLSR